MRNTFILSIVSIFIVQVCSVNIQVNAQKQLSYPASEIPEELLKNTNSVIRNSTKSFEIIDEGHGKIYIKYALTILNKRADHQAEINIGYDKLNKITSLEGKSFDKTGKLIKQIKAKDIKDYSAFDGFSIYTDNRMKYFDLRYPDYPYTIEIEVEMENDGILSFPGWVPYSGFNTSSQRSSLQIIAPEGYDIRYKELNIEPTAKEKAANGQHIISWEFGSFKAITKEPGMPYLSEIIPRVLTAPSDFEMEGYVGNMSEWSSFGQWENSINTGRDYLPEAFAKKIIDIVGEEQSRTDKIRKVYEYLQSNTRYISIQLGIGGWQTFPATEVATNGYGDCKALSNYMKSMLKSIDIESYYTLVNAGKNTANINSDFPSNQFNHMILCVPNYQDTIWLECTSQDNPFGYLGRFTGNRDVLVINDDGGKIAQTKSYRQNENQQIQNTNVSINLNGSATASFSTVCTGLQYDNYSRLVDIGESEQKKWLHKNLDLPDFELVDFEFGQKKQIIPEVSANIDVTLNRFASVSGKRIFFQPNIINKINPISIPQKERKYELVLRYPFEDVDTVHFNIPEGFHLEFIPEETNINSLFGNYQSQIITEEQKVSYIRKYSLVKGIFSPDEYINYVKFINNVADADKSKLVLVRST